MCRIFVVIIVVCSLSDWTAAMLLLVYSHIASARTSVINGLLSLYDRTLHF